MREVKISQLCDFKNFSGLDMYFEVYLKGDTMSTYINMHEGYKTGKEILEELDFRFI